MDPLTFLRFLAGLALLIGGADLLVRGASGLARLLAVPPLVVGLTIVAFGTSAPELAVSVRSAWLDQADLAVGNVLGSNIFNILFILGAAALVRPLAVDRKLVRLDVPIMIAASVLAWLLALDGRVGRLEGVVLFAGILTYTGYLLVQARSKRSLAEPADAERPTLRRVATAAAFCLGGLWMIVAGADWLVDGAVAIARTLGVSEQVIGLTLVAAGTSLPEAATSILAALRNERDLAIGNLVGSNLFNLLAVLGGAAALAPHGLAVSAAALRFDFPVMLAVAVACLPIFFTGYRVDRWEGALFLTSYAVYLALLVLAAVRGPLYPLSTGLMLALIVPLAAITIAVAVRGARAPRSS